MSAWKSSVVRGIPRVIGVCPFESPDARLVCALDRAGALGVLDLGHDARRAREALAVVKVMAGSFGVHIAEHGKDPRRYALLCTGGAGPVHAYYVAKKLGLRRLIAPCSAGVASALGLLIAPARVDRVATVARDMRAIVWADLEATFARLETEARSVLAVTLPDGGAPVVQRLADISYVGQASELVVGLPPGPYTNASHDALLAQFEASYVAAFTRTPPAPQVEIINVRVCATIAIASAAPPTEAVRSAKLRAAKGSRMVYFPEFREFRSTIVYDRYALEPGQTLDGHAVLEERESTLLIGPGGCLEVAASGNIIVTIG